MGFQFWLCKLLYVWLWPSYLICLYLHFHMCKMITIMITKLRFTEHPVFGTRLKFVSVGSLYLIKHLFLHIYSRWGWNWQKRPTLNLVNLVNKVKLWWNIKIRIKNMYSWYKEFIHFNVSCLSIVYACVCMCVLHCRKGSVTLDHNRNWKTCQQLCCPYNVFSCSNPSFIFSHHDYQ